MRATKKRKRKDPTLKTLEPNIYIPGRTKKEESGPILKA
jgi:hypothetical protein